MSCRDLHINLLGPLEIIRDEQHVPFPPSRKTRALLGYLITTGRQHSRKHLCDLLWENTADPRASLRWSLSKIRNLFSEEDPAHIITRRDSVKFTPVKIKVDALRVQAPDHLYAGQYPLEELEEAASLFRGAFMEDCEVPGAYRFNTWLDSQREVINNIQRHLFTALSEHLEDNSEKAIRYNRRLLQFDPYDEQAHIRLIKLFEKCGDTRKALDQYNLCKKILKNELDTQPSPALEKARISLIKVKTNPDNRDNDTLNMVPPLIGRSEEQEKIDQIIKNVQQNLASKLILVSGDPGIGKTHMLRNVASQMQLAGGNVLWSEANYLQIDRPYAPWSDLLQMVKPDAISKSVRQYIAPLLPGTSPSPGEGDRNNLFTAVLETLRLLGSGQKPLALLFDNLHWFDDPSLSLLNFVSNEAKNSNIIIVCSARTPELEENKHAFWMINAHRRENRLCELRLKPLNEDETVSLIKTIDPALNAKRIYADSKGNPLFAMEIAYALKSGGSDTMPHSLFSLIQDRLSPLDSQTRTLLNWMAVWGHDIRLDLLSRASECPFPQLLSSIEMLERYNIIKVESGDSYNFVHHLVQNAAYKSISEPRRRVIHRRIAQALMDDGQNKHSSVTLLHHAEKGEDSKLVVHACLASARKSIEVFAFKQANAFIQKGLTHLKALSAENRISLKMKFLEFYVHPGMVSFRKSDLMDQIKRCIGDAREAGLNVAVHKGLFLISNLHYQLGDFHNALQRIKKAEEAGRLSDPATMIRAIADTAKCFGMIDQKIDHAEALANEAGELAVELDLENKIYEIPMAMALVNHHRGQYDNAIQFYNQALELIRREEEDHWWECYNLQRFPMVELERNCPSEALRYCRRLLPIALKMGEGSEAPFAKSLQALALYYMGKTEAAIALDHELYTLRQIDSKWMIAYLQTMAAEHDLTLSNINAARNRALEALDAATSINRLSEKALACSILTRIAVEENNAREIKKLTTSLRKQLKGTSLLSTRALKALEKAAFLSGTEI